MPAAIQRDAPSVNSDDSLADMFRRGYRALAQLGSPTALPNNWHPPNNSPEFLP